MAKNPYESTGDALMKELGGEIVTYGKSFVTCESCQSKLACLDSGKCRIDSSRESP
jgi:hypothetical protein